MSGQLHAPDLFDCEDRAAFTSWLEVWVAQNRSGDKISERSKFLDCYAASFPEDLTVTVRTSHVLLLLVIEIQFLGRPDLRLVAAIPTEPNIKHFSVFYVRSQNPKSGSLLCHVSVRLSALDNSAHTGRIFMRLDI
jgi:hypothetical protein